MPSDGFNSRLKSALTGHPERGLVFLGNFEVEDQWARGEYGLPKVAFSSGNAVVNRMDELALLLGGKDDHVLLKEAPDPQYLSYLRELGIELPEVLTPHQQEPDNTVTQDALADPALVSALGKLAESGRHLLPHGVSENEERLGALAAMPLAAPSGAVCKAVNSKIYSRHIADELGVRQAPGWTCSSLDELDIAIKAAHSALAEGRSVVVKDAFGVSGKGILVVDDPKRLDRTHRMIAKKAHQREDPRIALVIEEWVEKRTDLNYQFTVSTDGRTRFDFVKEAITQDGVHKGHRIPARLTDGQVAELERVAHSLGGRLAEDGYYGVVGVDAMVDPQDGLYPVIEINARNNMSTYQELLRESCMRPGDQALVRQYSVRLRERVRFDTVRALLDDLLYDRAGGAGLLINNFATVNAAVPDTGGADGRLYGIVIADSAPRSEAIDAEVAHRLTTLEGNDGG